MTKSEQPIFSFAHQDPVVIAGPCVAESSDLLQEVCGFLIELSKKFKFRLVFKASFDKANRSSTESYRGPGHEKVLTWFDDLKSKNAELKVLTDIHECWHVDAVKEVVNVLQIPAFLCRQTDLIVAAVTSGKAVNIKKGQFLAPASTANIVEKAKAVCAKENIALDVAITERGFSFGYDDLLVDMRSFPIIAKSAPVIFDVTHSTQKPTAQKTTAGLREFAPVLARAAAATGYVNGFFLEVHPQPQRAKSDSTTQLSPAQAESLLQQVIPVWREAKSHTSIDANFV